MPRLFIFALVAAAASAAPLQLSVPRGLRVKSAGPILLPLSRRLVEHPATDGKASSLPKSNSSLPKSYYVGNIRVGGHDAKSEEKELLVFFDTGSGQVILDSTRCGATPCLRRRRYSPGASHAVNVRVDGFPVSGGGAGDSAQVHLDSNDEADKGQISADFVRDRLCLGAERSAASSLADACTDLDLLAVTDLSGEPFMTTPYDGIVGLGLEGLSIGPEFSFFGRLSRAGLPEPHFALFLPRAGDSARAEVAFGGHNPARLASPLSWAPVAEPEKGFWQVSISSASVDGAVNLCPAGCRGVLDSSSSRLGVPSDVLPQLEAALALGAPDAHGQCTGADILLRLSEEITLTLTARDYAERSGERCVPLFHPMTSEDQHRVGRMGNESGIFRHGGIAAPTFILGEPFFRRYYTVFDWEAPRIGFGLAAAAADITTAKSTNPVGTEEFILLQCKAERKRIGKRAVQHDA